MKTEFTQEEIEAMKDRLDRVDIENETIEANREAAMIFGTTKTSTIDSKIAEISGLIVVTEHALKQMKIERGHLRLMKAVYGGSADA